MNSLLGEFSLREGFGALHVMLLEVVAVLTGAHLVEPRLVFSVPRNGLRETSIEAYCWLPAQLAAGLLAVDSVAQVVSRPVGHELDEALSPAERAQNQLGHFDVAHFATAADVVNLAFTAAL